MTTPTLDLLAQLKAATQPYHARIGDNPYATALASGHDPIGAYQRYLARFYGFYAPAEARLARVAHIEQACPDYDQRHKCPLLERDLLALGLSTHDLAVLPRCEHLPRLEDAAAALGCLYVFEGATLGGQLLARQVRPLLGNDGDCAFFGSYGPEVGPMWRRFKQQAEAFAAEAGDAAVVASACAVFAALDTWLRC